MDAHVLSTVIHAQHQQPEIFFPLQIDYRGIVYEIFFPEYSQALYRIFTTGSSAKIAIKFIFATLKREHDRFLQIYSRF